MMQIKFNFNDFARVCHNLAVYQRHTPSSLAAVIGLSNDDVIALRASFRQFVNSSVRCVRCVGWKPRLSLRYSPKASDVPRL